MYFLWYFIQCIATVLDHFKTVTLIFETYLMRKPAFFFDISPDFKKTVTSFLLTPIKSKEYVCIKNEYRIVRSKHCAYRIFTDAIES
ncbi:hypothetical protein SS11_02610 [Klebsiella aerogenes]|nr:hypothetical protein SS11_02610 [Klebsiella aerogenes]